MKKLAHALLVGLVVVGGLTLAFGASPASAHTTQGNATPGNDSWHPWPSNKCTLSPDSIPKILNFAHACVHHDGCYAGFPNSAGRPTYWTSRAQCDSWFLADMQASCRWQHGSDPNRTVAGKTCLKNASIYHGVVRKAGGPFYKGPWK